MPVALAFSSGCFKHGSAAEVFARLVGAGIAPVEFNPTLFMLGQESAEEIVAAQRISGLSLAGILGGWCDFFGSPDELAEQLASLSRQAELARRLGLKRIRLFYGRAADADGQQTAAVIDALQAVSRLAPDLVWAFETHDGINADPAWCAEVLAGVGADNVRAVFDPVNVRLAGFDPRAGFERLRPWIVDTHMKDCRDGRLAALGEGDFPWCDLLNHMAGAGYAGSFTVEFESPGEPLAGLIRSATNARRMLATCFPGS